MWETQEGPVDDFILDIDEGAQPTQVESIDETGISGPTGPTGPNQDLQDGLQTQGGLTFDLDWRFPSQPDVYIKQV